MIERVVDGIGARIRFVQYIGINKCEFAPTKRVIPSWVPNEVENVVERREFWRYLFSGRICLPCISTNKVLVWNLVVPDWIELSEGNRVLFRPAAVMNDGSFSMYEGNSSA